MKEKSWEEIRSEATRKAYEKRKADALSQTDGFTVTHMDVESPWYIDDAMQDIQNEIQHDVDILNNRLKMHGKTKYKVQTRDDVYHTEEMIDAIQTPWISEGHNGKPVKLKDGSYRTESASVLAQVTEMGNITKVLLHNKQFNSKGYIKRIDKDHYMDMRTNETKEYQHIAENRSQNAESIRRTIAQLRDIINSNAADPRCIKWVTLTYAENMTDNKRLYADFDAFRKKFYRYCESHGFAVPEYINVVEPQGRGAWHCHIVFVFPDVAPWIPNADIERMWGHGYTKTKACSDTDNLGAYLSAYLTDIPLEDDEDNTETLEIQSRYNLETIEKSWTDEKGTIKTKRFVKGARLYLYPNGMKLYRVSHGIKRPVKTDTTYDAIKEKIPDFGSETFSRSYDVVSSSGVKTDTITQRYYNKKRP